MTDFPGLRGVHQLSAEMLGIGLAFVVAIFGLVAHNAADNLDDEDSANG